MADNAFANTMAIVDGLQYCNWSPEIFEDMQAAGIVAVHATVCYHENFAETAANIAVWHRRFYRYPHLLRHARCAADIRTAQQNGQVAVIFGSQNCSVIEDDLGLIAVCADLGLRLMQLSYNAQSLLASGWQEPHDGGITRMGHEAIAEMNRVGMVVDMSHSGERSTLQAVELSQRPVVVSHANPSAWCDTARNKSDAVIAAIAGCGGMLGFSLYPHHLRDGSDCTLQAFCEMVAATAERVGTACLGIGSDLCQGQPDSVVRWMRNGTCTTAPNETAVFPPPLQWFSNNRDFGNLTRGLSAVGFSTDEVAAIMGGNWLRFFDDAFSPASSSAS